MSLRVLVIGAGLGGLTLAQGLVKSGVDTLVFEADHVPEQRAQGARIHLDDRGIRALRENLPTELFGLVEATLGESAEKIALLADRDGELILDKTIAHEGDLSITGPEAIRPGRNASRRLLRRILAAGIEDRLHWGMQFSHYDRSGDRIRVHFTDGTSVVGDVLVGADGVGSAVRRQYLPHVTVTDTGMRWLGGKTRLDDEIVATGLPHLIEGSFSILPLGSLDMIVALMRFGERPDEAAARFWPGLAVGDPDDYVMWAFLHLGVEDWQDYARGMTSEQLYAQAHNFAHSAPGALRLLVDRAWRSETYAFAVGATNPVQAWPPTDITLLGDAIHAMPPNLGSGANTALQDARRLARQLAAADRGDTALADAIGHYEEAMRRDGFAAVRASVAALHKNWSPEKGSTGPSVSILTDEA